MSENLLGVNESKFIVRHSILVMINKSKGRNEIKHEDEDIQKFVGAALD